MLFRRIVTTSSNEKSPLRKRCLYIKTGKVRVDFYDDNQHYLESRIVEKGDVILLAAGGHGFEMLEDSEMIEVKQGPYCGEEDKVRFEAADREKIILQDGKNGSI